MQEYPIRLLQNMLETYSPSGSEGKLAHLLRSEMSAHGLRARIDDAGNVIGETGSSGPKILLCGHMDTVPGMLPVKLVGGYIYGRGAVDAKSSLAAMIAGCIQAKERSRIPFRADVVGAVEEESSSKGIRKITAEKRKYELAVFGEPSGLTNIIIGYKGSLQLDVTVQTRPGHSSSPWLSKNSFEEAVEFWNVIRDDVLNSQSLSRFMSVTGCVTKIEAGEGTNTIPSRASMSIDIRTPPGVRTLDLLAKIESLGRLQERKSIKILVSLKGKTEAYLGDDDSVAVRAFRGSIRKVTGQEVSIVKKTGTSDMNEFAEAYEIPMIAYGPGDSSLDHTEDERVGLDEFMKSVEVYASAIERFASLAREPLLVMPAQS